jgi:hypothetical protein
MDNFTQILQQLPMVVYMPSTYNDFGCVMPFKIQVNFEILLF